MIAAAELVAAARSLLGTPYRHQGKNDRGVDCIGFVFLTCERAGLDLQACFPGVTFDYARTPDGRALTHASRLCEKVSQPEPGALVLFEYTGARHPQHFAILGDGGRTMIHAHQPQKRVIEHGYRHPWVRWTHSLYRIPGVDY